MDIGEVAKSSGLPASTLRFYEEKGLIQSSGRQGLRRQFSGGVLQQLALISLGRSAGFSLEEIASMLTPNGPTIDKTQLLSKADELDKNIQQLINMRDGLRHAADCPAPRHIECPSFQRMLRIAAKKQLRWRNKLASKLSCY
ncbi:MAG: helix-turn-helix domain-containing protein [Spongiibacteraceae bacterium]|nr:helix-turn-helix domain-containing protein [Spongiibacteraceae bacterium]